MVRLNGEGWLFDDEKVLVHGVYDFQGVVFYCFERRNADCNAA